MNCSIRHFAALVTAAALLAAIPATTQVQSAQAASCPTPKVRKLPAGASAPVFVIGIKGGSIRNWKVTIDGDGTIAADGTTASTSLIDPKSTLPALMTLANAQGFFSLKKTTGCISGAGNPDVSSTFITVHTSTGTKRVAAFGTCDAQYTGLFDLLSAAAKVGM